MVGYFGWCPTHAKQLFTSRKQARRALRERCHVGKRAYPCEAVAGMWQVPGKIDHSAQRVPHGGNQTDPTTAARCGVEGIAMPRKPLEERFWAKVERSNPDGCWTWTACLSSNGYGKFVIGVGRSEYAHRVSAMLAGLDIAGHHVCHRCDNPPCVRPDHLFVGAAADNLADMARKGRSTRGERDAQAKLTAEQVMEIRRRYVAGEYQRVLGAEFGLAQSHVSRIVRGEAWVHLPVAGIGGIPQAVKYGVKSASEIYGGQQ